ncbi:type I restriction-modification system subunit M [Frateuria terrea]|uniref:site-specific DNA-methyltransferase (adenine-specific) n=1 Tax=Frateuria terrea TaxID=529704 RepID=A0A1H6XL85_9GAMM|nr:class I SAM-dependent DNA methyltransferase [Frateuria terrea]SEJ25325.1 type I restriction enzyme M protein [Frateuria terrea]SFP59867.1 type I restriction enzyme M protein [Frateuria terrea]
MTKHQLKKLEADLWRAADSLRANSDLKASEYSTPVLGLIFLKFADNNYRKHEDAILAEYSKHKGKRSERKLADIAVERCGFYLPEHARYDYLLHLPDSEDIAKAIKGAMLAIEIYKPELQGVLPQDEYFRFTRSEQNRGIPRQLLKNFADIPADADGDLFGQIYEYFLAEFAMSEGQGGGEFFTPRSVVQLMVGILQPHGGTIYDPACGSGGMFVQSAHFIEQHRRDQAEGGSDIYVYGQEKTLETVKLAKMNLAVNGLRGEIMQANTYYEDPHHSFGAFDYVMANPPFNVDDVSLGSVEGDRRFNTYGIPRNKTKVKKADEGKQTVPNANYLWINLFATSLKPNGRAALVMANSASDARHSEADIRRALIEANLIYGMLTLPSNMFYTVTLPATLWFFDKAKPDERILFIDARNVFTQIDRAHREFSDEQVRNLSLISQLRLGDRHEFIEAVDDYFAAGFAALAESHAHIAPLAEQLLAVLDDAEGRQAVSTMQEEWAALKPLQKRFAAYQAKADPNASIAVSNRPACAARTLRPVLRGAACRPQAAGPPRAPAREAPHRGGAGRGQARRYRPRHQGAEGRIGSPARRSAPRRILVRARALAAGALPRRRLRGCHRAVQAGHAGRGEGAGLVAQSRALRGRGDRGGWEDGGGVCRRVAGDER